jgi:oxygen-independent coproporphyrinogen III oxidase
MSGQLINEQLIEKYSVAGPRYTSYPTAVEFTNNFGRREWIRELESLKEQDEGNYSLYLHLPFCPSLCLFCACHKVITKEREVVAPYLTALRREIEAYQEVLPTNPKIEQLHWGGGSPNYFAPAEMELLGKYLREAFPNWLPDADISVELDPRTTSKEQLLSLRAIGFNRVSMGVQDFDASVQEAVNRIQSFESTAQLVQDSRALGFHSVGIDLIYGLPAQNLKGFDETLNHVLTLRPGRIALYGYAHVTWRTKVQKALTSRDLPTPQERIRLFMKGVERLTEAGYEYIGMDHFALPEDSLALAAKNGSLNRNFMGYTTHRGVKLIGMGASSISTLPDAFAQNVRDISAYQEAVELNGLPVDRGVKRTSEDKLRGEIIENLLCHGAINFKEFESKWRIPFLQKFKECIGALKDFEADDILRLSSSDLTLTPRGRFFMRNVAMVFDAYLEKHKRAQTPVFSQAV